MSTVDYYRYLNEETNRSLGGYEFSKCILYSLNFGDIVKLNNSGKMDDVYTLVLDAARKLSESGADCLLLCANTLHRFYDRLKAEIDIPIVHIAVATADEIRKKGLSKVGLIGTIYTMEEDFYRNVLEGKGIEPVTPGRDSRLFLHEMIMEELVRDVLKEESIARLKGIVDDLLGQGIEGLIMGCTEFPPLLMQEDYEIPLFDTTLIHARAAVEFALGRE